MDQLPGFKPATRDFFARDSLEVGPALLGAVLQRTDARGTVAIRLTEVEAYGGERDPGSHAYRGKTARTASLFGEPGHVYCYFTYGMHHAINLVSGRPGQAYGCLVRAGEVMVGSDLARERRLERPRLSPLRDWELARGPACVAQCLAANRDNDGDDLFGGEWRVWLPEHPGVLPHRSGPRVGLGGPGGSAEFPWRYWLPDEPSVSAYRAAYRAALTRARPPAAG
jgi:DNA-3-methyladenine glycosylase